MGRGTVVTQKDIFMNIKALLCLGATFVLSTFGGQALAGVLNDPDTMEPFFY